MFGTAGAAAVQTEYATGRALAHADAPKRYRNVENKVH
jgi:hypothetical protein